MSLKRPLEESDEVGETSGETAAKRLRTTSTDNNNDNKDVNNSNDDSGSGNSEIKKTEDEDKKEKTSVTTTSIVKPSSTTTTTVAATKPFGGIFGSTSTSSFGSSFGSGTKSSLGFGAVSASSANSIFGKIDKSGFGTPSSSSTDTATGAFGKISSKSSSFPAFGSKSQSDKKNSIFSEEVVPVFGSEKSETRALSPGLTENNVKINGEEDEETVLATRAKLFEMQVNELAKKKETSGTTEDDASKEKEIKQQNINDISKSNKEKGENEKDGDDKSSEGKEDTVKKKPAESSVAYEWKTRGVGEIRLKEEKHVSDENVGKIRNQRLVMRREYGAGSIGGEVILNAQLNSDVKLVRENDSHLRLTSFGIGGKVVTHLIRIKRFKDLEELERKVKYHIDLCKRHAK
jgi:hypothetical protein